MFGPRPNRQGRGRIIRPRPHESLSLSDTAGSQHGTRPPGSALARWCRSAGSQITGDRPVNNRLGQETPPAHRASEPRRSAATPVRILRRRRGKEAPGTPTPRDGAPRLRWRVGEGLGRQDRLYEHVGRSTSTPVRSVSTHRWPGVHGTRLAHPGAKARIVRGSRAAHARVACRACTFRGIGCCLPAPGPVPARHVSCSRVVGWRTAWPLRCDGQPCRRRGVSR